MKRKQKLTIFVVIYAVVCVLVLLVTKRLLFDSDTEIANQTGKTVNSSNREVISDIPSTDEQPGEQDQVTSFPQENMEIESVEDKPVDSIEVAKDLNNRLNGLKDETNSLEKQTKDAKDKGIRDNQKTDGRKPGDTIKREVNNDTVDTEEDGEQDENIFESDDSSSREYSIEYPKNQFDNSNRVNNSFKEEIRQGTNLPVNENLDPTDGEPVESDIPKEKNTSNEEANQKDENSEKNKQDTLRIDDPQPEGDTEKENVGNNETSGENTKNLDQIPGREGDKENKESKTESGIELPVVTVE